MQFAIIIRLSDTQIHDRLREEISRCLLLTEDQKGVLLNLAGSLSEDVCSAVLDAFVAADSDALATIVRIVAETASRNQDEETIAKLDAFFKTSSKQLRRAEESAERSIEASQSEQNLTNLL